MESPLTSAGVRVHDFGPHTDTFLEDLVEGLSSDPKRIPSKYFYDADGSRLFDEICDLEEYYPTRTELGIMTESMDDIVACIGPCALVVEYGSGSSTKTRLLLDHLEEPVGYVPIDISCEHLTVASAALAEAFPDLEIAPVCADYTESFELPSVERPVRHVVVYFPGSTIGNFMPEEAKAFLVHMADMCGAGGGLLIGVDLQKSERVLRAAYDDAGGVTAAFNKNVLARANRELGADFELQHFAHEALYDSDHGRVEMRLVSLRDQTVQVGGKRFRLRKDERIITEYSYKYSLSGFEALASEAGFRVERVWTDTRRYFSVQYLIAE